MSAVLLIGEHDAEGLKSSTRQGVQAARSWELPVDVLLLGDVSAPALDQARQLSGVRTVLNADAEHLNQPIAEDVAKLLQQLADDYQAVVAAHSSLGRNVLPRFAALLDVGMISEALEIQPPHRYVRPVYAGNLLAEVENTPGLQVVSVRASRWKASALDGNAPVEKIPAPAPDERVRFVSRATAGGERPDLASAPIVISGGRSLGSAEQFDSVLGSLATRLGAALGATRAAVDAGYAPNNIQVGQTGTIVAPELYIGFGVSGAIQHLAGMKDSRVIVAVNIDPEAPIFQVADYGLVADLFDVVPQLEAALK